MSGDPATVDRSPGPHPSGRPRHRPLSPQTVLALQDYRAYPSVSLLLTTRPGPALDPDDAARLADLVDEARARLAVESSADAETVSRTLGELPQHVDGPVDRAVAFFVSTAVTARVDLPVEVVDRTVVDPTFATRDLVRALHRTPRHVVLLLADDQARLLDGAGDTLSPVHVGFPLSDPGHRPGEPARLAFLIAVDKALGAYLRVHPAPLVIVGTQPTVASFRWTSRHLGRLAGVIVHDALGDPDAELRSQVRDALEQYLVSRRAEALALLENRRNQDEAVFGVAEAWLAARWERPEMLAVEQGYFYPARLDDGGDSVSPADDPHEPDVVDDLVDELIELVLSRGGWVAILDDGDLPGGAGVALLVRHRGASDRLSHEPLGDDVGAPSL